MLSKAKGREGPAVVRTGQVPAPGPHIPALRPPASLGPRGTVASGWAAQRKALAERAAGVPVAVLEPQPFPAPKGSPGKKDGIFWDEPVSEGQEAGTPILGWERWDPGGQASPSEGGQTGGQDEGWRRPDTGGGGRHVSDSWGAGGRADASVRRTRERSAPHPGRGQRPPDPWAHFLWLSPPPQPVEPGPGLQSGEASLLVPQLHLEW